MTPTELLNLAHQIKIETVEEANSSLRVGSLLEEIIKYFRDNGGSGGGTSFVGAPITTTEALDAAFTPGVYGVNLPENYQDWGDRQFSLLVMPYAEYPINAFQVVIFSTLSLPFSYKIYIRFGNSAANPKWTPWGSISGGGGVVTETDPVFAAWLATSPISHFFGNNTLEFASADLLDDLFAPGDYGIHINAGFHGKTNMNLTIKFASNDGTGGDGDQDYFQIIKFDTGEEFIRKYEHMAGATGAWSEWQSKLALQQWVTDNFAFKDNGIDPPVSEDILLTTAAPNYTVTEATADNINVSSTAAAGVGTVTLPILPESKQLKISIKTGSNSVTISGTAYVSGVVVFAVFDEPTGTWTVDSTLDPVIPDYSDVRAKKRVTLAPTANGWAYTITGISAGGGVKGDLIFVDFSGSALCGIYAALTDFTGATVVAQKVIEGTALNIVRVNGGSIYHSAYDGVNLGSLRFDLTVSQNEKDKWNKDTIPLICSDEISDLTASTTVAKLHYVFRDTFTRTLSSIIADLNVAATGSTFTLDIKKNGVSIFSTLLTIDAGETSNATAAIPYVLTGVITFTAGDYIDIYVTLVGSVTAGKGLKINLLTTK